MQIMLNSANFLDASYSLTILYLELCQSTRLNSKSANSINLNVLSKKARLLHKVVLEKHPTVNVLITMIII